MSVTPDVDSDSRDVHLDARGAWFSVETDDRQVHQLLAEELAWFDPEAEYKDAYKRGNWDGYHRLYYPSKECAPVGLLHRAADVLTDAGYAVSVSREFDRGASIRPSWQFDHDLRDYQHDAVEAITEQTGGIVALPTGAGKTVVGMRCIHNFARRALVLVHRKSLLSQWTSRLEETLDVSVGVIGDGNWSEGAVTVASVDTVLSRGVDQLADDYGTVIFDECHVTSAADSYQDIGYELDVTYRIGLSATPWRRAPDEKLEIEAVTGGVAVSVAAEDLIEEGHLANPTFRFLDVPGQSTPGRSADYFEVRKRGLVLDSARNNALIAETDRLAHSGRNVLVAVDELTHGHLLTYALDADTSVDETVDVIDEDMMDMLLEQHLQRLETSENLTAAFLNGSTPTSEREQLITDFKVGKIDVLVSTVLQEGADIPSINALVLAGGGKSDRQQIQRIGRALRPSNGAEAVIVDVNDSGPYLSEHAELRRDTYNDYYGSFGPGFSGNPKEEAVTAYLSQYDFPTSAVTVAEQDDGTVTVELDSYLEGDDFTNFRAAVASSDGIRYDGDVNRCDSRWVQQLVAQQS